MFSPRPIARFSTLSYSLLLALALLAVPEAQAAQGTFELYAGGYHSDSPLDDEPTVGLRGSYRFSDRWGIEGTLGRAGLLDLAFLVDVNASFAELSAVWYANPGRRAEVFFYSGLGVTTFDNEIFLPRDAEPGRFLHHGRVQSFSQELATYHAGIGLHLSLFKGLYLRPDLRGRWIDNFSDSDVGVEATLGLGWRFGKRP
ncbi:MAG: outer membrane beta-barrel protein [Acidobacteriota bacterium]